MMAPQFLCNGKCALSVSANMSSWPTLIERPNQAKPAATTPATQVGEASATWQASAPLLTRLLAARGIAAGELDVSLQNLPDPSGLVPAAAVELLLRYRERPIVVVADYDVDGASACAVMVRGLRLLGFTQLDYLVPDRFADGYGLTPAMVERAHQCGAQLIITVDNGIASLAGADAAKALGIELLVTDHHLPGEQLPAAAAIVNPRLVPNFKATELAGVGVAFYLLIALRQTLRANNDDRAGANLASLLDLVALGTVADVVVLDTSNRILVEQGLRRMRAGKCCAGVEALVNVAGRELTRLCSADMGFALGPRLNAAGRLADMTHGIQCLLTDDVVMAQQLAEELDAINRDRRLIETGMQREAETQLSRLKLARQLPPVLSLYSADWHEGVVGLLASRVKDKVHRPVFAFADSQHKGMLKGSGRSIAGLHLRDALAEVAAQAPGLIEKFGGHSMAAGLSMAKTALPEFRQRLEQVVNRHLTADMLAQRVVIDGSLEQAELSLANAEQLTLGAPWGQGFPAPLFHGYFELLSNRLVGEKHLKLTLGLPATNGVIDAIHFKADLSVWPQTDCRRIEAVYSLESNFFRNRVSPQLRIDYLRPA